MLALSLALGSSIAWGLADFLGGVKSRQLAVLAVLLVSQVAGLVAAAGAVLLAGWAPPGLEFAAWATLSGVADLLALWAFYRGLAVGVMSLVAPIAAIGGVVPVAVGLASGERPSATVLVGIGAVLVGAVAATVRTRAEAGGRILLPKGVGLAMVAALSFGVGLLALDRASGSHLGASEMLGGDTFVHVAWVVLLNRGGAVMLIVAAIALTGTKIDVARGQVRGVMAIGVLDLSAIALFALASTQGLLAVVAAVGSLYPVATILLARAVLGERMGGVQLGGVGIAMAGVAAVAAG